MMNEETEEAQIIEVEQETPLGDDQSAEISLESPEDGNAIQSNALSEEDLDKRREKTQKRINKLVAQRKESEEREAAAMQFAQQQKSEVDALRGQLSNLNTGYSSEATSRIDSQEVQAKTAFKEAYEAGEVDKMADAQQVMAKIAIEKERLRIFKDNQEKQKASAVQMQQQQAQMQQQQMQQQALEAKAQEDQQKLQVEMQENDKDRQNDITIAEIRSAGFGAQVDINQNQVSDYQDAMKDIRETTRFQEQTNLKRDEMAMKGTMESERLQVEREKIAATRDVANKDLQIARTNKNQYDVKDSKKSDNK